MEHFDSSFLQKQAPDGTTPLFMAFIKGHKNLLDYFKSHHQFDVELEDTRTLAANEKTFLTKLSQKFPVFNDEIRKPALDHRFPMASLKMDYISRHVIGDLCPLRRYMEELHEVVYISDIIPSECESNCPR